MPLLGTRRGLRGGNIAKRFRAAMYEAQGIKGVRNRGTRGRPSSRNVIYRFVRSVYQSNALDVGSTGSECSVGIAVSGLETIVVDRTNGVGTTTAYNIAIPGASDFPNLFDEYRIKKVVVKFIPRVTESGNDSYANVPAAAGGVSATTQAVIFPNMMTSTDDDSGIALNRATLSQYQNQKLALFDKILTYTFYPKLQTDAILGASTFNQRAVVNRNTWIDTATGSARYLGFHANMKAYPYATCDMQVSVHYEFKGVL